MMDYTIEDKILERMEKARRGLVFSASDFAVYGNSKANNKALERLAKQKKIIRVGRGIYTIPRKSKFFGHVSPGIEVIAQGIARRDKARIMPTGLFAENLLGLSTQVPMKIVYLTDGTPRKLMIDETPLIFKKNKSQKFGYLGKKEKMKIKGKSRHFYDIYRIAQTPFADKAIADRELYKSIVAHRERFSKLGGVDYSSHFPPNLNPIPPAELMPAWERDYKEIQGQMIVGENIGFERMMSEIKRIIDVINREISMSQV
jgi:hypothetical protein